MSHTWIVIVAERRYVYKTARLTSNDPFISNTSYTNSIYHELGAPFAICGVILTFYVSRFFLPPEGYLITLRQWCNYPGANEATQNCSICSISSSGRCSNSSSCNSSSGISSRFISENIYMIYRHVTKKKKKTQLYSIQKVLLIPARKKNAHEVWAKDKWMT